MTFPTVDLEWKNTYTVHLNTRPGVRNGLVLRELPIDLVRPLPLCAAPRGRDRRRGTRPGGGEHPR